MTNIHIKVIGDFSMVYSLQYCSTAIKEYLNNHRIAKFKIGKTAGDVQKRYDCDDEYKNEYDEIISIYETKDKKLIDKLEQQLIDVFCVTHPNECKNMQVGGGPNCADSKEETASIYIVVKYA